MGTGDILLGGNPAMDKHPIQGGVAILLSSLHATGTGNKLQKRGPLARIRLYLGGGPVENLWGGGGVAGEVQKKYSRKAKLNEKNSCMPINPKNIHATA